MTTPPDDLLRGLRLAHGHLVAQVIAGGPDRPQALAALRVCSLAIRRHHRCTPPAGRDLPPPPDTEDHDGRP